MAQRRDRLYQLGCAGFLAVEVYVDCILYPGTIITVQPRLLPPKSLRNRVDIVDPVFAPCISLHMTGSISIET
jgi:hypothetical protein